MIKPVQGDRIISACYKEEMFRRPTTLKEDFWALHETETSLSWRKIPPPQYDLVALYLGKMLRMIIRGEALT